MYVFGWVQGNRGQISILDSAPTGLRLPGRIFRNRFTIKLLNLPATGLLLCLTLLLTIFGTGSKKLVEENGNNLFFSASEKKGLSINLWRWNFQGLLFFFFTSSDEQANENWKLMSDCGCNALKPEQQVKLNIFNMTLTQVNHLQIQNRRLMMQR